MSTASWSIVLCSRDGSDTLEPTLRGLVQAIEGKENAEVLLIDNASEDDTPRILAREAEKDPRYRFVSERRAGKSFALNSALSIAHGEWIAFIDDDMVVDRHWLDELDNAAMRHGNARVLAGQVRPLFEGSPSPWARALADGGRAFGCTPLGRDEGTVDAQQVKGGNMAVRRRAIGENRFSEQTGNFGSEAGSDIGGEDTAFARAIAREAEEIVFVPAAIAYHQISAEEATVGAFFQRQKRIGRTIASGEASSASRRFRASAKSLGFAALLPISWLLRRHLFVGRSLNGIAINLGRLDYWRRSNGSERG